LRHGDEGRVVLVAARHAEVVDDQAQAGMPLGDGADQWQEIARQQRHRQP
jgi:hypothetical protein